MLELGRNLLRMRAVVTSAEQVPQVQVRGLGRRRRSGRSSGRRPRRRPRPRSARSPRALAGTFGAPMLVAADSPYLTQGEVDDAASALAEQVAGGFAELEGVARGNPLRAGRHRGDAGRRRQAVRRQVHGHRVAARLRTRHRLLDLGDGQRRAGPHAARAGRRHRRRPGGGVGRVGPGDRSGRRTTATRRTSAGCGVTFPWLHDDFVSGWARTVQPGRGQGPRRAGACPEVGDEVLVAFEQRQLPEPLRASAACTTASTRRRAGDVPLIDANSGAVNRRSFVSRTGHRIELSSRPGGPTGVRIRTGDGTLRVELDQQKTEIVVHSDGTVTVDVDAGRHGRRRHRDADAEGQGRRDHRDSRA